MPNIHLNATHSPEREMAQVIDLAKARKQRQQEQPKNRAALTPLTRKAAKAMQRAQAVRMAHIGRL